MASPSAVAARQARTLAEIAERQERIEQKLDDLLARLPAPSPAKKEGAHAQSK